MCKRKEKMKNCLSISVTYARSREYSGAKGGKPTLYDSGENWE